eukprot:Gb_00653 [translate_table: standard]
MGKYMRKGKGVGEVAVMEVSQGSLGVRTRARTLASQKDRKLAPSRSASIKHPTTTTSTAATTRTPCVESMQTSYLELRSRKLEKISRCYHAQEGNNNNEKSESLEESSRLALSEPSDRSSRRVHSAVAHSRTNSATFSHAHSNAKPAKVARKQDEAGPSEAFEEPASDEEAALEVEASFGENVMDHDSRERRARETTPSSLIRNVETLETPGSTTRPAQASSGRRRMQNEAQTSHFRVPTSSEIEEFFAGAEQQEQRRFAERYNYDPVSDLPLPGRFEWVRLRP